MWRKYLREDDVEANTLAEIEIISQVSNMVEGIHQEAIIIGLLLRGSQEMKSVDRTSNFKLG